MAGDDPFPDDDMSPSSFDPHEGFPSDEVGQSLFEGHPFLHGHFQQAQSQPVSVDLDELVTLIDDLETHGYDGDSRQDWSVEREQEISRLEQENFELRKMLGIDEESMNSKGLVVDPSRLQVASSSRLSGSDGGLITRHSTPNPPRPSVFQREKEQGYGEQQHQQMQQQQQQQMQQQQQEPDTSGAPLQRAADLTRRGEAAGRRPGIFGRGASRPAVPTNLWNNVQQSSPAQPVAWPGGTSGVDLSR